MCRVSLSDDDRQQLELWIRSPTTPQRLVRRSLIVVLAADGASSTVIARRVAASLPTVRLWLHRFASGGPAALLSDAPGRGRRPSVAAGVLRANLLEVQQHDAATNTSRASIRALAQALGVSRSTVWRTLRTTKTGVPEL